MIALAEFGDAVKKSKALLRYISLNYCKIKYKHIFVVNV